MRRQAGGRRSISAARRGQIIQRVIVDDWTTARAADAFGLPERLVEIWVADYRRRGMASLRQTPYRSIAAELVALRLLLPAAALARRLRALWRQPVAPSRVPPAAMPGEPDDRRGGSP
jgi:transposase-like protein